jgi:SAM-dependent methyltransferase
MTANASPGKSMDSTKRMVRYTDRHKGRGAEYHETFSPDVNPYRAMVWRLEQLVLDRILRNRFAGEQITHLDFACGTGRILEYLAPRVTSSVGIDVSTSMLEVAKKVAPAAELIEADLTERDVLGGRRFNLITAFRFFPNAEPELRQSVFSVLAGHLTPDGALVFNNHKNRDSLRARILRLRGRAQITGTMTHQEVVGLLSGAGLRIQDVIPVASLPLSEKYIVLPVGMVEPLERWITRWAPVASLAQDIVYVCTRPAGQAQSYSSPSH